MSRLLVDPFGEIGAARADFQSRWADACAMAEYPLLLEDEEPLPPIRVQRSPSTLSSDWLEQLLDSLPDPPIVEGASGGPAQPFDPSRDSAATVIDWAKDVLLEQFDDPLFSGRFDDPDGVRERILQAFNWAHQTLDLEAFERRLKDFPNIVVQHHVSNKYGVEAPHGLFACLSQVRWAYAIGADLAALTQCRSVTELLIRKHYASDIPGADESRGSRGKKPSWLIEQVQNRQEFAFIKKFNLKSKVDRANDILHKAAAGVENWDSAPGVVTEFTITGK